MKRYLLFQGRVYYPDGGTGDFVAAFATEDEAKSAVSGPTPPLTYDYWAEVAYIEDDGSLRFVCALDGEDAEWSTEPR